MSKYEVITIQSKTKMTIRDIPYRRLNYNGQFLKGISLCVWDRKAHLPN